MSDLKLNLTRKWRAKVFDHIVGQDLSIRMLKNSLYKGQYFPVYLFSGQRGCGKTSSARVFAAAINCAALSSFQDDPKSAMVPCGSCASCSAFYLGKHPDFIEIDAASHTGVDNIRQIIDASSLMPLMGRKKIYLIDEAHMLSKAAFNALLKILEEPPSSVLFILATTDSQKIIETVKSRCFQLFFKSVASASLLKHLQHVCQQEGIKFDPLGLELIVQETGGSVRDAINLLEQVRFSTSHVEKKAVLRVLGHLDNERLIKIFELIILKKTRELLIFMREIPLEQFAPEFIWRQCIELTRELVWIKHGITPKQFKHHVVALQKIAHICSFVRLNSILEIMYAHEEIFFKTTSQHAFLEMLFLQMSQDIHSNDPEGGTPSKVADQMVDLPDEQQNGSQFEGNLDQPEDLVELHDDMLIAWQNVVCEVEKLNEPLLTSLFKQGIFKSFDGSKSCLYVEFSKEFIFFKDWLQGTKSLWLPLVQKGFGQTVQFDPLFIRETILVEKVYSARHAEPQKKDIEKPKKTEHSSRPVQPYKKNNFNDPVSRKTISALHESKIDVSDAQIWKTTHLVLKYFPGTVTEVQEPMHG